MPIEFKDFPQGVKDVILSEESIEANKKIITDFGLAEEKVGALFEILRKMTSREIPPELLPEALKEKLGFDEAKARQAAVQIAGLRLLVLSDFLKTNIEALIKKWGGDTEKFGEQTRERYELRKKLEEESGPRPLRFDEDEELTEEEEKAEMIGRAAELKFEDENLKIRFQNLIVSYLKGIRTKEQIKEMLARPQKIGGMSYGEDIILKLMAALEEIKKEEPEKVKSEEMRVESEREEMKVITPSSVKYKPFTPIEPPENQPVIAPSGVKENPRVEEPKINLSAQAGNHLPPPAKVKSDKISAEKILPPTNHSPLTTHIDLLGPVEEIREFKLIDFKRLDANPKIATEKIKRKIDLLEKDSILKKIEGIKAWQNSEVYKLYIQMGYECLLKSKPLPEIIKDRRNEVRPALSEEEFYAIAELNAILRF